MDSKAIINVKNQVNSLKVETTDINEINQYNQEIINKNREDTPETNEKMDTIPKMLKCFICDDFCIEPMQIFCCNENFCFQHIRDEIMKNFVCPNCNSEASMKNLVENKKLKENIEWYKKVLLSENLNIHNTTEILKQQAINTLTISQIPLINPTEHLVNTPLNNITQTPIETDKSPVNAIVNNDLKINQLDKSKEEMNTEEKLQFYESLNNKADTKKKSEEEKSNASNTEQTQTINVEQSFKEGKMMADYSKMYPNMRPQDYYMYMQAMQKRQQEMYEGRNMMYPPYYQGPYGYHPQYAFHPGMYQMMEDKKTHKKSKSRSSSRSEKHKKYRERSRSKSKHKKSHHSKKDKSNKSKKKK